MSKAISIITESLIFLSNEIKKYYEFYPRWYRKKEIRENVLKYYYILRTILKADPNLPECLTRCKHCGIFFLTGPQNIGRVDIACPFGCRESLQKKNSTRRSTEYYRTKKGKKIKSCLNQRRYQEKESISEKIEINIVDKKPFAGTTEVSSVAPPPVQEPVAPQITDDEDTVDEKFLKYLKMIASLIEHRQVTDFEILAVLRKKMRQHSIDKEKKVIYIIEHIPKKPP